MSRIENVSRRDVLRAGAAGGALVLATSLSACDRNPLAPAGKASAAHESLNLFVAVAANGDVEITCHRAEMGQGAKTGMARVIADELEADWARVHVVFSPGDEKYGDQNTDGSTTIRKDFMRLRRIGATARAMLENAAAARWGVPAAECKAELHEVVHDPTGKRLGYGDLAADAGALEPPAYEGEAVDEGTFRLKTPAEWRYIGKGASAVDLDDMLVGKAVYGQDLKRPGMKYAVIARPPVFYGKAVSYDADAAKAVSGVIDVIDVPVGDLKGGFMPLGGVAVIAENTWAAIEGRRALNVEWDDGANAAYNSPEYRARLEAEVQKPGKPVRRKGDADAAFANAAQIVSADYYTAHLSHAQMEPPAAVAEFKDGKVHVWTSTQNLQQARLDLAEALGLDYADVTVNNALLGGGFGRKSKPDFSTEAALLARAVGAPIKVVWTREDDIAHDYLHTVVAQRLEAALDDAGKVTGWRHRVAFPSIGSTFDPATEEPLSFELDLGMRDNPFAIPNMQFEQGRAKGMIRVGWLRSVNNIPHAFAVQSFAAELAHAAGRDPKDYLLELIGEDRIIDLEADALLEPYSNYDQPYDEHPIDTGRLKNVLNIAADDIGWRTDLPAGRGMGIAAHRSFLSYVAVAMEVAVSDDGVLDIARMSVACDCGVAVNPESVRAQMEGGAIFGVSNALESAITATAGRVDQSNFHDYRVLRMPNAPRNVSVRLVESSAAPGGVGEPGTPPAAPALANAIFAATGKRLRELPLLPLLRA